jgi:hypothetical protein
MLLFFGALNQFLTVVTSKRRAGLFAIILGGMIYILDRKYVQTIFNKLFERIR